MKIFVGGGSSKRTRRVLRENGIGEMLVNPLSKTQECPSLWAFDNGAFVNWKEGKPFDSAKFQRWLEYAYRNYPRPYLAVLPDKVGEGMKSFEFSLKWKETLTLYDWPWYLALQDGMESAAVIGEIDKVSGLFLGGTDDFKKQAGYWKKIAHHSNRPFHYARAGTLGKLAHAIMIGADSLDSAFPLWTKDRLFAFIQALSQQQFPQELLIFEKLPQYGAGAFTQIK